MSAMSNARTEGGEKEKRQDFFTSFRELTMEMRQNETRDERRETRRTRRTRGEAEKQRSEKKERRGKEGLARTQRRVNRKG